MTFDKTIIFLFNYFWRKRYSNPGYSLDENTASPFIASFIKIVSKQLGYSSISQKFLLDYFLYAWQYWWDKETKRPVTIGWIVGKKMIKRYLERNEHSSYFVYKFVMENNINIDYVLQTMYETEQEENGLDVHEELEKQRFFGVAKLYNCINTTTLYNHRSMICLTCDQKLDCKKMLEKINYSLYKKRGY